MEQSYNPQLTRTQGFFRCPYKVSIGPDIQYNSVHLV